MKIKTVIFDKDGVLLDSEGCNVESGIMSFQDVGIELEPEDIEIIKGRHPTDYHSLLAKKYNFNEKKVLAKKMNYYWKLYDQAKLFPGVLELLSKLKQQHFKLALVTSSEMIEAKKMIDRFDLNIFNTIVSFEDCQHRKPAPDCYLIVAKKLNVSPSECVVIEDSPIGVKAAKSAGMKCIAVTNTFPKEQLQQADYIIDNLNKIKDEWLQ